MRARDQINGEVEQYINETIRKELAPNTRVVKVNMRKGVTSSDGSPAYRIDIIYEGDRPVAEKFGNMMLAISDHLWEIEDEHFPVYSLFRPENEAFRYAPR